MASVTVNGAAATLAGASFTASITLSEGENTLSVVALDELGHQSTNELTVTLDTSGPVITVIEPANGSFTHSGQLIADATDVATKTPCTARRYSAVGSLNGKIYVIGGIDVSGQPTDLVEEYDPPTDTWSTKNNFPLRRLWNCCSNGRRQAHRIRWSIHKYSTKDDSPYIHLRTNIGHLDGC